MLTQRCALSMMTALLVLLVVACKSKPVQKPEGYRVVGYDGTTQQWTIIRTGTFDGKYLTKKLVVRCLFYKWGNHDTVEGPDACHLQVGHLIVPTPLINQATPDQFVDVYEMPDQVLSITEGDGPDRVMQQFKILSYTVMNP